MSNSDLSSHLVLPISSLARQTAQAFADEQVTIHKARQVFLNTLSVWVLHDYLTLMQVETNLNQGDSWNPLMRQCTDVADLAISDIGVLECRPVFGSSTYGVVPPEAWWDRIAYSFVHIEPPYTQATLLGCVFQVKQSEISIRTLQPMDDLLSYLHQVRRQPVMWAGQSVYLQDWFTNHNFGDWFALPKLLAQIKPFSFRGQSQGFASELLSELSSKEVSRGKFVPLGLYSIPLSLQIEAMQDSRFKLTARVFHGSGSYLIPRGLIFKILDAEETVILETQARSQDGMLQLQFSGAMGEVFQIRLSLEDRWVTQTFMI